MLNLHSKMKHFNLPFYNLLYFRVKCNANLLSCAIDNGFATVNNFLKQQIHDALFKTTYRVHIHIIYYIMYYIIFYI